MTTNTQSCDPARFSDGVPSIFSTASVWRRIVAYLIDGIILGILGTAAGTALFDVFSQLGLWGRLLGFCVSLTYFALLDSRICDGQTFGKRWLKLRVIDAEGNTLSFANAIIRYVIFAAPLFLCGIRPPETRTPWIAVSLIFIIVLWVGGSTLYLMAFNPPTRQGLHDLAVGSYVVKADAVGPMEAQPIWKAQWTILCSLLVGASLGAGILNATLEKIPPFPQMRRDAAALEQMERVRRAHVRDVLLHSSSGGGAKKELVVSITLKSTPLDEEVFAGEVARTLFQNDRGSLNYDQVNIRLFYGYDIGIASHWNHSDFAHTPAEWRQRVYGVSPAPSPTPAPP